MLYVDQAGVRVSSGARENHERGLQIRVVHLLAAHNVIFEDRLDVERSACGDLHATKTGRLYISADAIRLY